MRTQLSPCRIFVKINSSSHFKGMVNEYFITQLGLYNVNKSYAYMEYMM